MTCLNGRINGNTIKDTTFKLFDNKTKFTAARAIKVIKSKRPSEGFGKTIGIVEARQRE